MNTPLFELQGVHRQYRMHRGQARIALHGIDLSMPADRHLGIIGESGAGKSTLLRLLLALETADSGQIWFRGKEIAPAAARELAWFRREVQHVAQDPASSLNPRMTVADIIREPLHCLRIAGNHAARVTELLTAVGLDSGAAKHKPAAFSGGQRQRIAIARALAPEPSVLIGDEPLSSLDPHTKVQLLELLDELAATRNLRLVLVSHDLGVVERLCDDVAVLAEGQLAEFGTVDTVFRTPASAASRQLLSAAPRLPVAGS
ncbi:peptide/nickel transport system ATP-binding protein [Tamaricihabitans halophyticus]|uniref:Peptide/nickel transport system ATP-binding protein n=1 Tax=Tamaricihabitans halophyticus TaxID=1262583 RepID=A0A4V2SUE6_9PSEU|nr:ATP-binding cassette domain-containing protein [Tamaricihabitans halophyticus]TCP54276.1 peptide/nickel transport system ATP-binding protein [Tamaricihabitans halophyticus]